MLQNNPNFETFDSAKSLPSDFPIKLVFVVFLLKKDPFLQDTISLKLIRGVKVKGYFSRISNTIWLGHPFYEVNS